MKKVKRTLQELNDLHPILLKQVQEDLLKVYPRYIIDKDKDVQKIEDVMLKDKLKIYIQ